MRTSIVVPMWNEESWVEHAYDRIKQAIKEYNLDVQIVFATDGCTDRTIERIEELQKKDSSLLLFNHPGRLGRGRALKKAFLRVKTPFIIYMDSDLATDLKHLPQMINYLEQGADIVTGSRLMRGSKCIRSRKRKIFSTVYNFLAKFLFRSKIHDHQCGFKGFNRKNIMKTLREVKSNGWFWDAEILIRGQRDGLNVVEFPISWCDRDENASKVNLWKDAKNMGIELVQLRVDILPKTFFQMISFAGVGVSNTLVTLSVLFLLENTIGRGDWGYYFAYSLGIINSFVLNRRFTFKEKSVTKRTYGQFVGFVGVYFISMIIYSETARFLEMVIGLFYLYAATVSLFVEYIFTFSMSKLAIFREIKENESSSA
ncbi:glycosyltransferase [Candidatus Thorarchaeota archaeon]|nr:MAG: glycosyltransferase [Candidatus Thorarchaeota archaeon]